MTLENLLQIGKPKPHEPSRDELQRLIGLVEVLRKT
jgi:hypothetical protein